MTGVIGARALHPTGRGALIAIVASPGVAAWIFGMGAMDANSYWRAKHPEHGPSLISTWLIFLVPLGLIATVALELTLPVLVKAQTPHVLSLARLWAPTVILAILMQILNGNLLGAHDYRAFNLSRYLPLAVIAVLYLVLYAVGEFTVTTALLANLAGSLVNATAVLVRIIKMHQGFGKPRRAIGRPTFVYGLKAHGSNLGMMVSARLDLLIMPAFLPAASVGLYSVGTNVSWIVLATAGAIAPLVLPAAARTDLETNSHRVVLTGLLMTFAVAVPLAIIICVVAGPAIRIIYGSAFLPSVAALRLLLPGCVMLAGAQVIWSGLNGAGRPGMSAITQLPGVVITVTGLSLFLQRNGIAAAAIVSSLAYASCFVSAGAAYMRFTHLSAAEIRAVGLDVMRSRLAVLADRLT